MQVNIINYKNSLKDNFYKLNIEWLQAHFYVEHYDEQVLKNPQKYILDNGGVIFFAEINDGIVGTVALMPTGFPNELELTKMAVSPLYRGKSIGQMLMKHCIDYAEQKNVNRLLLYSNTKLENAIYIYKKYGFIEIPIEHDSPYKRSNIKMELSITGN